MYDIEYKQKKNTGHKLHGN